MASTMLKRVLDPNDPGNIKSDPWSGQPKYALTMGLACSAVIFIASMVSLAGNNARALHIPPTLIAMLRYLSYRPIVVRRPPRALHIRLPTLGVTIFLSTFAASFAAWALAVGPYYRTDITYGSPPLSLRAASLAVGLIPFVYALGSRVNFIAIATGSSHERLQVYHQWASRFVLLLATIHVVPFIVQNLRETGLAGLQEYYFSDQMNITGTASYCLLFLLVFSSFRRLREWCYEVWVLVHILTSIAFLALLFVHTGGELTSWRYLWGAAGLYGSSVFLRLARQLSSSVYFMFSYARLDALPANVTRITVSTNARWKAGQHIFIRFPSIEPWSSHPFTIVSLPNPLLNTSPSTVILMARARGGLTKMLHERAGTAAQTSQGTPVKQSRLDEEEEALAGEGELAIGGCIVPAILDGPYGCGASVVEEDEVLYIAGGSGITFVIASLVDLAWQTETRGAKPRRVKLVWSIVQRECIEWVRSQLDSAFDILGKGVLEATVHVTGPGFDEGVASSIEMVAKGQDGQQGGQRAESFRLSHGRPSITSTVVDFIGSTQGHEAAYSVAIVACGPREMMQEVRMAGAEEQWHLVCPKPHRAGRRVRLLVEEFDW